MAVTQDGRGKQNHQMSYAQSSTRNENKYITLPIIKYLVIPLPKGISLYSKCKCKVFTDVVVEIIISNFSLVSFRYKTDK